MLSVTPFEMMYAAFGSEALMSDVMVAELLCIHMCFFSAFQLFSGTILDYCGGRIFLPLAAGSVFVGMLLQVAAMGSNFFLIVALSQTFLTCGASFGFIGVEYLSRCVFSGNKAKMAFSFAQAMYGLLCATFWVISSHYEQMMRHNFYSIVWGITALQFVSALTACCTSNIPQVRSSSSVSCFSVFSSITRHICCVTTKPEVWKISLIGGMMFGIFFSLSSLLLYKYDSSIGGFVSTYVWIGFALGAPLSCWMFLHFRNGKRIFFAIRILQCFSLCCLLFIMQKVVADSHNYEMEKYAGLALAAMFFGILSGGHMIAFIIGTHIVDDKYKSVCCAIINGFMCVIAGMIILIVTIFAEFYKLQTLLICTSCISLVLHCLLERHLCVGIVETSGRNLQ
ncbi:hypothetical protein [Anaplasma bovis]|uniref:hypothetical protein n=1 Tax=Anaplasma bovis TaxID=186733 RepID=UPI002FF144C2